MVQIKLDNETLENHWGESESDILSILSNMEDKEIWTLDSDFTILKGIVDWAAGIGTELDIEEIEDNQEDFIKILSFMKSSRAFYLIKKLEIEFPGVIVETLASCVDAISKNKTNPDVDIRHYIIHRDRLSALYKVEVLERIYSSVRTQKIKTAIEETAEKYGGIYDE